MIAPALFLLVAAALQQEPGPLDVPVYRDEAAGVSLPRPFADWVFSPGGDGGTTTVIFQPRDLPLSAQLWGALVLTSFDEPVRPGEIAERRVRETWRPTLGRTFRVLARDSADLAGLPAVHVAMTGAVERVAVDVEEYFVARGADLFILQLRYPHGLPRDSIAAGYERTLEGLTIRPPPGGEYPAPAPAVPRPAPASRNPDAAADRALAGSPWRPRGYDALVRFDAAAMRLQFSTRVEAVNVDAVPHDSLAFALPWPLLLDGARSATGAPLELEAGRDVVWVRLPRAVDSGEVAAVSVDFHAPEDAALQPDIVVLADGAHVLDDWLPWVAARADSGGAPLPLLRPAYTVRFDVPAGFTAVAAGRLTADFVSEGRRRMTWIAPRGLVPEPLFVIGRLRRAAARADALVSLRSWVAEGDSAAAARAGALADVVIDAWRFYTEAFGRLAVSDAYLLVTDAGRPGTAGATLRLPRDAPDDSVRAAVARVWWGSSVRFAGPDAGWLEEALPGWSVLLYHEVVDRDRPGRSPAGGTEGPNGPAAALQAMRRLVGDAVFRTALRRLFLNHRSVPATRAEVMSYLGLAN